MGAHPLDYLRSAPPHSYIHVDDFSSPEHLAEYLHELDANDTLYNSYFRWKGTGEYINTKFLCRLCSMVNLASTDKRSLHMWYKNINTWWNGPGVCRRVPKGGLWATWRNVSIMTKTGWEGNTVLYNLSAKDDFMQSAQYGYTRLNPLSDL